MGTVPKPSLAAPDGRGAGWQPSALLQRGQIGMLVTLIVVTVGAWGLTVYQARTMSMPMGIDIQDPAADDAMDGMNTMDGMEGMTSSSMADMDGRGWSLAGMAAFVLTWAVMMVAMMLPAVAPLLLLYRAIAAKKQVGGGAFGSTWILVTGYLLVWTGVGLGVYGLVRVGSDVAGRLGVAQRQTWAPLLLGAILVVAGLYQFTPLKHTCLRQCQSPFGFVMGHWRDGRLGALRMGIVHGAYCLGCCWALFTVLVVTGVMSLAWMLLLTLVVFAEKVLPHGQRTAVAVGLAFIVLGVLVATGMLGMPWIT